MFIGGHIYKFYTYKLGWILRGILIFFSFFLFPLNISHVIVNHIVIELSSCKHLLPGEYQS